VCSRRVRSASLTAIVFCRVFILAYRGTDTLTDDDILSCTCFTGGASDYEFVASVVQVDNRCQHMPAHVTIIPNPEAPNFSRGYSAM